MRRFDFPLLPKERRDARKLVAKVVREIATKKAKRGGTLTRQEVINEIDANPEFTFRIPVSEEQAARVRKEYRRFGRA